MQSTEVQFLGLCVTESRTFSLSQPLQSPFLTGNRENLGIISDKFNVVEISSSGNYTNG